MLRSAAVAGQFYPGRKDALEATVRSLLPSVAEQVSAIALVVPHAGYVYSGGVAGETYAGIAIPDEVVILGPNHHGRGHLAAVYAHGSWETPLGRTPIAEELAARILKSCPLTAEDELAHLREHSLEVQLPFLQVLAPQARIVPLCIGHLPLESLLLLGDGLAAALLASETMPLIVASNDMSHFESGSTARKKDSLALERVLDLDAEGLYRVVRDNRISMCGVLPVVVMLQAAKALGATRGELICYRNSGDVTGDQSEVVGYAGVRIT